MVTVERPRMLFRAEIQRKRYLRRFFWMLLATVAALGAVVALDISSGRGNLTVDAEVLRLGKIVGVAVAGILLLRAFFNLFKWLRTRAEKVVVMSRGIIWERKGKQYKYSWSQVRTFREGLRSIYLFGRPVLQRGAHVLKMRDDREYRITGRHGDTRLFLRAVRPYIADVTGVRMARLLRENRPVKVHKNLILHSKGLKIGKKSIPWSQADIKLTKRNLSIAQRDKKGKFKVVKRFSVHDIDNLGGFMEVATTTIRHHQPKRFNIKTAEGYHAAG